VIFTGRSGGRGGARNDIFGLFQHPVNEFIPQFSIMRRVCSGHENRTRISPKKAEAPICSVSGLRTPPSLPLAYRNAWIEGEMNETGKFVSSILTEADVVGGAINPAISDVEVAGPWSITWNPPADAG
jgi:hypothetical protein